MAQHKVDEYHKKGIMKKPPGIGHPAKVSTSTCQVCLNKNPKAYVQSGAITICDPCTVSRHQELFSVPYAPENRGA